MTRPRHLLVTNDFPPKVGGIQNYLWELWSRLDPSTFTVLTASSDPRAGEFDAEQRAKGFSIERIPKPILFFPTPSARRTVDEALVRTGAELAILDPAFPLGAITPKLRVPAVQILHGAEVTIPGRLPFARSVLARTLNSSAGLIAAGTYPEAEARRAARRDLPPVLQIPPGVDVERFVPISNERRRDVKARLGLDAENPLIVSVSRLVPRKGMDTLIKAASLLSRDVPDLTVAIGGSGRDEERLRRLIRRHNAPVTMLGRVNDEDLPDLIAAADVFVMACRSRWGGLEQEGFGIVFVEAAAAGVPQIAGRSGGASDAVVDGSTGLLLDDPSDPRELSAALLSLLRDPDRRAAMGAAGRRRAVASFGYDVLANRLGDALEAGWPLT